MKKYLFNCFLLLIPILLWNVILAKQLPQAFQSDIFWDQIPLLVQYGENISRIIVFGLTCFMPLQIVPATAKKGIWLYIVGTVVYFGSWTLLIYFPTSQWSKSWWGFVAPAYTPLLWLLGIGLLGRSFYFNLPYKRWVFIVSALVFLAFHIYHTNLIYLRMH